MSGTASYADYSRRLQAVLAKTEWSPVAELADAFFECWKTGTQVFLCGNGGSAANAIHLANDFFYGISKTAGSGMRITALPANGAVMTCLANDVGYEDIYSLQLEVLARPGDVLVALSGSGNSPNIVKALESARRIGMKSFAVLGYSGGKSLRLADVPIHFPVDDMQISEDMQMIVGHMVMQRLYSRRDEILT